MRMKHALFIFSLCVIVAIQPLHAQETSQKTSLPENQSRPAKQSDSIAADPLESCKSSYDAVYTPLSKDPDNQGYKLTMKRIKQKEIAANNLDEINVTKSDEKNPPIYEIKLIYTCSGGSFPSCTIVAPTNNGKNIKITPAALNKDFSYNRFFIRNDAPVPYALIFPGADQMFYYLGRDLTEGALKFHTKKKPFINSFPVVWHLESCN